MKNRGRLATIALAIFSIWVPLVGIILWYTCKKGNDLKAARLFMICAIIGFIINFIPRLLNA